MGAATVSIPATAKWLFLAFFAAFAVKVPLFPFHTWLPDAHTEAPTAGSVVLAGVLLKMGTYGFLRFSLPLFPQAAVDLAPVLLVLATIGIIYGAIVAAMQPNLKRIVAYSSVAHLGFVVLGVFALTTPGHRRRRVHDDQPRAHHRRAVPAASACSTTAATRTRSSAYRGLWKVDAGPRRAVLSRPRSRRSACPASPGSSASSSRCIGTFIIEQPYAVVATTGVILAAVYLLWAFQRTFMGEPDGRQRGDDGHQLPRARARGAAARALAVPRLLPEARARPHRAAACKTLIHHVEAEQRLQASPAVARRAVLRPSRIRRATDPQGESK